MRRWALLALAAGGCGPAAPPPQAALPLDCAQPFEALKARIIGQAHLVPAPRSPTEPYRFYSTEDGAASYLVTEPDAPAHPAIMMQRAAGAEVRTTGCRYGEAAAYDQLLKYLDGLKSWRRT